MIVDFLLAVVGIALLLWGASLLVSGSSRLAGLLGVPPVLIGLTVVAWGTSAPELVVALAAAAKGSSGIVLGNVIGSNLANTGLILGLAALIMSPAVEHRLWTFDLPAMLGATALFVLLLADGTVSRFEGVILCAVFLAITVATIRGALASPRDVAAIDAPKPLAKGVTINALLTVVGAGLLIYGGHLLVGAATDVARVMGVPDMVIGMTLVAVGTSLPELAATLVAAARHENGIAVGNVIGSNIFNLLAVTGPAAAIRPVTLGAEGIWRETGGLIVITLALPLLLIGRTRLTRSRGLILLLMYVVFLAWRLNG